MKNMKMSDVFNLPVFYEHDPLSEIAKFSGWHGGGSICKSLFLAFDDSDADTICNAINNHDRLVEENAELRELVKSYKLASDEVTKYKHALSYNESYAGEPNGEMKNNLAELDMVSCKALKLSKQIRLSGNA